jgi:hypothetical protein
MQWKKFNFPDERIFHYSRILEVTKMTEHPGPVSELQLQRQLGI